MKIKLSSIAASLTIGCCSCAQFAYIVAQNVYENQPTKSQEKFKSAKGVIQNNKFDINNYKSSNKTDYFIAVASSGGGYRAAYTTIGALEALEELPSIKGNGNFLQDVDLFSSVSGSGIAVGYYLAKSFDHKNFLLNKQISNIIANEKQSGQPNILRVNLDNLLFKDGKKSEYAIQAHFKKIFKTTKGQLKLKDIFVKRDSSNQQKLPIWLINATIFQNMAGIVINPENLIALGVLPKIANNMNSSTAAVASAAYPMAIPPLKLESKSCKKQCFIYLMDGGIYDNLGVMSALRAIKQAKQKHKILLVIDASERKDTPFSQSKSSPKPIDLMEKIPSMVTESHAQQIKQNLNIIAEDTRVIFIQLSDDKKTAGITTRFNSNLREQKLLIAVGKELVLKHPKIKQLLDK